MNPDLLVLGAGPAGISISYLMAQKGFSVEILDPASFPRTKICGEFLNPQATEWLQSHGLLPDLLQLQPFPIFGMKISDREGKSFTGRYSPRGQQKNGYAIERKKFDAFLVANARKKGIQIQEGHCAKQLLFDGDRAVGVTGTDPEGKPFEKRAKLLIGADGRNNLIGRTFGWIRGIRNLRKYAFVSYFENVPELDHYGEVHLVRDGYVGIAPINPTLANVALVIDEKSCPRADSNYEQFLLARINESPLARRFNGCNPIAPVISAGRLDFKMKQTSGYGTLLVGDTCGFIDPFTGEGINYAFLSADLASDILAEALKSGRVSHLKRYESERREVFP